MARVLLTAKVPTSKIALVCAALLMAAAAGSAQTDAPLPETRALIEQVRDHQRQMQSIQENYTFHETQVSHELDKKGAVKKTESVEFEIFFVNTHEIRRLIKKDGKDLDQDQQKKVQDQVMKEIDKAQQTPPGQSPRGDQSISVSHILAMAKLSAPRREMLDGRRTIVFDFTGDPHAKAHNVAEEAALRTSGTFWIDEKDRQVRRLVAQLDSNVHAGFGLLSLSKGSHLTFDQKLVNNELWLPTGATVGLVAHAIGVIGFRADIEVTDDGYRKFHAEAQQQTGTTVAPGASSAH